MVCCRRVWPTGSARINGAVALNADNITDERYYQTMGSSSAGNWYGKPSSYTLTLRGTF